MTFSTSVFERKQALVLLTKLVTFLLVSSCLLFAISHLGNRYFNQPTNLDINSLATNVDNAQIVTIGSSQNSAISNDFFKQPVLRLDSEDQTYDESFFILNKLKSTLAANHSTTSKIVVMPMSIGSLGIKQKLRPQLLARQVPSAWLGAGFLETINYHFLVFYRGINNWVSFLDKWLLQLLTTLGVSNQLLLEQISHSSKAAHHIDKNYESNRELMNLKAIERLYKLVNEVGACLVLYQSPVSLPYQQSFISRLPQMASWKNAIRNIVNEAEEPHCVLFIEDIWPIEHANNHRLYIDQDHLNEQGAALFTPLLKQRLCTIKKAATFSMCQ